MLKKDENILGKPDYIFDEAFMDKRLGIQMYLQSLEDATFDVRLGIQMYREYVVAIVSKTPEVLIKTGDFIKKSGISAYGETRDGLIRSSDGLDFAVGGIVSDRVFEKLGFPERGQDKREEDFVYKKDAYFGDIEQRNGIEAKYNYCDIFIKTKHFQGRKLLFEELMTRKIPEYEVMLGLEYTTKHDSVLRMVFQKSSLYLSGFLDKVSHYCYNLQEVRLYFDILYQNIGLHSHRIEDHIPEVERIIRKMRKGGGPITRSEFQGISKTISLLKIRGLEINYENIQANTGLYTFVPSILNSTHGENSITIDLVKGFVISQRPISIKTWGQHFNLIQALLGDGETVVWIKKQKAKLKMRWNNLVKKSRIDTVLTTAKKLQVTLGEKKLELFLRYTRRLHPNSIGGIDMETHKECMKNYFMVDKILKDIESNLHVEKGEVKKKPSSRVLNFILGRGKSKSISPFATQAWIVLTRFPLMGKFLMLLPLTKIVPLLLIAKTTFVFAFYKIVDIALYFIKMIPVLERFRRFQQIQKYHKLSSSPELQDLLIDEIPRLKNINRDIGVIRKVKKLKVLQYRREQTLAGLNGDDTPLSEELSLEVGLLESEMTTLLGEIDQQELQENIQSFKLKYLDILEEIAKESDKSFLES